MLKSIGGQGNQSAPICLSSQIQKFFCDGDLKQKGSRCPWPLGFDGNAALYLKADHGIYGAPAKLERKETL
jgi:hypothetical protein